LDAGGKRGRSGVKVVVVHHHLLFILGFFSNEKSRSESVRAQILSLSLALFFF